MRWFERFRMAMLMLFRRQTETARLNDELQFHLDQQIKENIARGLAPEEARYAALRAFGNPTRASRSSAVQLELELAGEIPARSALWCAHPHPLAGFFAAPRFWSWRWASAPPLRCSPSCARCCSSRCPSATRTSWSWSTSTSATYQAVETDSIVVSPADFNDWHQQTHGFEDMAAWHMHRL